MLHKIAALLAALTAAIHFFVGGSDALAPMLLAELPAPAEGAMHAVWHMVSIFLLYSAAVFWFRGAPAAPNASGKTGDAAFHFAILWVTSAIVFIYVGLYQEGFNGMIVNPQWTILLVTGVLVLVAEYKRNSACSKPTTNES